MNAKTPKETLIDSLNKIAEDFKKEEITEIMATSRALGAINFCNELGFIDFADAFKQYNLFVEKLDKLKY